MSLPDIPSELNTTETDVAEESDAQTTPVNHNEVIETDKRTCEQTTDEERKQEQNLEIVDQALRAEDCEKTSSGTEHVPVENPELAEEPARIPSAAEPSDTPHIIPEFHEKLPSQDASEQISAADSEAIQPVQTAPVSTSPTPPSTQKLTLKIQRSASSVHVMRDDIAKPETDLTIRTAVSPDLDEKPKLEILESTESKDNSGSPVQAKLPRTAPKKRPVTKRKRVASGTDEETELLNDGTEINGFVYYSACRSRNDAPGEQPVQISAATGRIRRRAAINNKLVSGRIADTVHDEDNEEYVNEKIEHIPVKREPKPVNDDPTAKLARVRASLAPFAKRSVSAPTARKASTSSKTVSTSSKLSAKKRLSKKLGLGKRL